MVTSAGHVTLQIHTLQNATLQMSHCSQREPKQAADRARRVFCR